mmetsp:Transcript_17568/g.26592  ORF Transcript_17568/g.26592 Transcript_17568/m.26592 type:complete len:155 (+) Transcript_17568:1417-1881(+)
MQCKDRYKERYSHNIWASRWRKGTHCHHASRTMKSFQRECKPHQIFLYRVFSSPQNKYQGGTLGNDGLIYAIPSDADNILCIDTDESGEESKINGISYLNEGAAFTIGDKIPDTKDKWQGGFLGNDGSIYCIPENFNRIMKVVPNKMNSKISFL